jgi:hypothetical protein
MLRKNSVIKNDDCSFNDLVRGVSSDRRTEKSAQSGRERTMGGNQEIMAVLSCMGHGYKVKVLLNGADIGIVGGKSENKRLFDKDNEIAAQATPDIRKKNFTLVNGQNTISVEFTREGTGQDDKLDLSIEMENYPAPLFKMVTKMPCGKVEKTFMIQNAPSAGFKSVSVAD